MKKTSIAISALLLLIQGMSAAEVYFDTVSTAKAGRLQGAYIGTFAGGANVSGTSTAGRLGGMGVDGKGMGWIGGVEFGYKWATPVGLNLASELEIYYLNQDLSGGNSGARYRSNLRSLGAMVNGIVELDLGSILGEEAGWMGRVKPYVGAGVGLGYGDQDKIAYKPSGRRERTLDGGGDTGFAYQLMGGVEVEVSDTFSVYGEYRYMDLQGFGSGDITGAEISTWVLGMKFQY